MKKANEVVSLVIGKMKQPYLNTLFYIVIFQLLSGCSLVLDRFSENLNQAVKSNNDPETVKQALPAYLVLLDGLVQGDPENEALLFSSAKLMNAYSALLGAELDMMSEELDSDFAEFHRFKIQQQQKQLSTKALERAITASCLCKAVLCGITKLNFKEFEARLAYINKEDISFFYNLATAWASWLQNNSDDWNARAKLPHIKAMMEKIVELDETWDNAGAHLYLGVLNSIIPENFGGKPEKGKQHFESAIRLSEGKNLMAKALYAQYYARLTFNEALHEQLVSDVLTYADSVHDLTLINTVAKQKAQALKLSAKEYF